MALPPSVMPDVAAVGAVFNIKRIDFLSPASGRLYSVTAGLPVWTLGPKTTAIGDVTRTNGSWAFGTDGKVYYGTAELGGGDGAASALRSTIGGIDGVITDGANWIPAGAASFSAMPAGGSIKIFASGEARTGMVIEGVGIGNRVDGEARVLQNGSVIATGSVSAWTGGGDIAASVFFPSTPITPVQTGATTLTLQVRSNNANKNIGGAGISTQIYAEWTKNG